MVEAAVSETHVSTKSEDWGRDDCLSFIRSVSAGRVVVVKDELAKVLPVAHVLDGDSIVFQLARTLRTAILEESLLTFQADGTDEGSAWTVTVQGVFDVIDGLPTLQPPPGFEPSASAMQADIPTIWVRIRPDVVTGGFTGAINLS